MSRGRGRPKRSRRRAVKGYTSSVNAEDTTRRVVFLDRDGVNVTDVRRRMDFRLVRDEFFGPRGPASTMVEVSSLSHPDYLIEIEAIAVL